jgi:FKBP-type peptidyl-prolyl cis-trans isomerase (trigger factor)
MKSSETKCDLDHNHSESCADSKEIINETAEKIVSHMEWNLLLNILGRSVRFPGFRPGKIPEILLSNAKGDEAKQWISQMKYEETAAEYKTKGLIITEFKLTKIEPNDNESFKMIYEVNCVKDPEFIPQESNKHEESNNNESEQKLNNIEESSENTAESTKKTKKSRTKTNDTN